MGTKKKWTCIFPIVEGNLCLRIHTFLSSNTVRKIFISLTGIDSWTFYIFCTMFDALSSSNSISIFTVLKGNFSWLVFLVHVLLDWNSICRSRTFTIIWSLTCIGFSKIVWLVTSKYYMSFLKRFQPVADTNTIEEYYEIFICLVKMHRVASLWDKRISTIQT